MRLVSYIGLFLFIVCVIGVSLAGVASIWEQYRKKRQANNARPVHPVNGHQLTRTVDYPWREGAFGREGREIVALHPGILEKRSPTYERPVDPNRGIYAPIQSRHVLRNLSHRGRNLLRRHRAFLDRSIGLEKRHRGGWRPG